MVEAWGWESWWGMTPNFRLSYGGLNQEVRQKLIFNPAPRKLILKVSNVKIDFYYNSN